MNEQGKSFTTVTTTMQTTEQDKWIYREKGIILRLNRNLLIVSFVLLLFAFQLHVAAAPINKRNSEMDYKAIVEKVIASQPWTKTQLEKVFGVELQLDYSTGSHNGFTAKNIKVSDGLEIEELTLKSRINSGKAIMVIVDFTDDSACIPLKQVSKDFPELLPKYSANPESVDSESVYAQMQNWGELAFGFKLKRPDCLASIVFSAKEFL